MASIAISLAISAGGMALQYLLSPKVKAPPSDKGKLDDIRIQGSDYGAIIPRTWGLTRLAGNLVVSTGVDEYQFTTTAGGGKKSPTPATTNHIYKTSLDVLICRNQISRFLRIWADADLINNNSTVFFGDFEAENASLTGGAASFADGSASGGTAVQNLGNGGKATFNVSSIGDPPAPRNQDPDELFLPSTRISFFYKCATNLQATIDTDLTSPQLEDFPASPSDWTAKTIIVPGFVDSISYENAGAAAPDLDVISVEKFWELLPLEAHGYRVSGVVNPTIAYPADLDDPSEYYNYPPETVKNGGTGTYELTTSAPDEQIRFYTGTETQTADAKIKSWLDGRYGAGQGVLRASAMRGLSHVVFQDRTLKSSRVENFTFETDTGDATVNTILEDLFADVGLVAGDYDITATAGLSQAGFLEHQKTSRKSLIEYLERYHFFRIAEIDGKIKTIADTFTSVGTLSEDSLRAHGDGEEMPRYDAEVIIKEEHLLPREVRVSVMQPDLEYHNEAVPALVFTSISGKESVEYTFPIVDPASAARNTAERLLLKAYSEDKAYEIWGMPDTADKAVGDVIEVPINGTNRKMRIEKRQMTLPIGKIRFQCVAVSPFTPTHYQDDVTNFAPKAAEQYAKDTFPRNSIVFVIQSEAIMERDRQKLGVYLAICGRGRGDGDKSALYREMDEDNFVLQDTVDRSSPVGLCEDTLADWASGIGVEDTTNVLDIWFFDDVDLETVTQADIDRNPLVNLIRVGDEWLQFRTAAAQTLETYSPYRSKWRISNLWRGKFGTSGEIAGHGADEYAAIVTPALMFYELEIADIGETVSLKAATNGQAVDVAPVTTFTFAGPAVTNAPVIGQVFAAEQLLVRIGVRGYTDEAKFRMIEISDEVGMGGAESVIVTDDEYPDSHLAPEFLVTRASGTTNVTKYVRVSHSSNGRRYGEASNILEVTFATDTGTGGSTGSFSPVQDYEVEVS